MRALELVAVSLLIAGDVSWAVYNRYTNTNTNTSYVAHLTGALVGLMVGFLVLRNRYVEPWEKILKVQPLTVISFCFIILFTESSPASCHPPIYCLHSMECFLLMDNFCFF